MILTTDQLTYIQSVSCGSWFLYGNKPKTHYAVTEFYAQYMGELKPVSVSTVEVEPVRCDVLRITGC